jgi:CRISPR-associated endonuclease/helicase Cas3
MEETGSKLIAHVRQLPDDSWAEPHLLEEHLDGTSGRAAQFASLFQSESWGRVVGMTHDTGKSPQKWQKYLGGKSGYDEEAHLEGKAGKMDHSTPGAKLAEELFGKGIGRILAYCIAGHHAGLPDWLPDEACKHGALRNRLSESKTAGIPPDLQHKIQAYLPGKPPWDFSKCLPLALSLWVRMLFSCLVDADFLDTEQYMEPEKAGKCSVHLPLAIVQHRFETAKHGLWTNRINGWQ